VFCLMTILMVMIV